MEQQTPVKSANKAARTVNLINGIGLVVVVLLCLPEDGGFFSFILGCLLGLYNFISMLVYIAHKNTAAFISNMIWMLLMPIIGFGCCAATFEMHGFH